MWFALEGGELSEVYYPRLDTPSFRDLQFSVDGVTERDSAVHRAMRLGPDSLTFRQINTDKRGHWRLIKTYVADTSRSVVLIDVALQSLDGRRHRLSMLADAAPSNETDANPGSCLPSGVLASDAHMAIAVAARPALQHLACSAGSDGIVASTALTDLTGKSRHQQLTLALAFAGDRRGALAAAHASLRAGWNAVARRYVAGWHAYLTRLRRPPRSLATVAERQEYTLSAMVLAASEDKIYRGAFVASPTMPWAWGTGLQTPSGPYHLVWSRDLYEIATALIADGDVAAARRALRFLLFRQQRPDGSFPQNSDVTGKPALTNLQLDEVADPIILAWQLGAHDPATWVHVKRAADFIVGRHDTQGHTAPYTPQERWENQAGYSPATIATEIAGLDCAGSFAQHKGDPADAGKYLQTADRWRAMLDSWTLTTTGPYVSASTPAYYLRLTKDGNPNVPTTYSVGDSGPTLDQRAVVDPSFLELVRLGVVAPDDSNILSTIRVVDAQLSTLTPNGRFWHRYTGGGYGEQRNGAPWNVGFPRPWPRATRSSSAWPSRSWPGVPSSSRPSWPAATCASAPRTSPRHSALQKPARSTRAPEVEHHVCESVLDESGRPAARSRSSGQASDQPIRPNPSSAAPAIRHSECFVSPTAPPAPGSCCRVAWRPDKDHLDSRPSRRPHQPRRTAPHRRGPPPHRGLHRPPRPQMRRPRALSVDQPPCGRTARAGVTSAVNPLVASRPGEWWSSDTRGNRP